MSFRREALEQIGGLRREHRVHLGRVRPRAAPDRRGLAAAAARRRRASTTSCCRATCGARRAWSPTRTYRSRTGRTSRSATASGKRTVGRGLPQPHRLPRHAAHVGRGLRAPRPVHTARGAQTFLERMDGGLRRRRRARAARVSAPAARSRRATPETFLPYPVRVRGRATGCSICLVSPRLPARADGRDRSLHGRPRARAGRRTATRSTSSPAPSRPTGSTSRTASGCTAIPRASGCVPALDGHPLRDNLAHLRGGLAGGRPRSTARCRSTSSPATSGSPSRCSARSTRAGRRC